MSTMTLLSCMAATAAIVTIFAPRPLVRVMFLADEIGLRTRRMLVASVIVPWASGAVLFLMAPMSAWAVTIESLTISLIVTCMAAITIYSGRQNHRADGRRRRAKQKLITLATQDMLTGVMNRAGLKMQLDRIWESYRMGGPNCGVILIDLDHFKRINDMFGHDEGDRVLAALGDAIRPLLRHCDALGRWGGEEFLMLLPNTDIADLPAIAERVRLQVQVIADMVASDKDVTMPPFATTASVGVSGFLATDGSPQEAISRADRALYQAKGTGRNRLALDPALALPQVA